MPVGIMAAISRLPVRSCVMAMSAAAHGRNPPLTNATHNNATKQPD